MNNISTRHDSHLNRTIQKSNSRNPRAIRFDVWQVAFGCAGSNKSPPVQRSDFALKNTIPFRFRTAQKIGWQQSSNRRNARKLLEIHKRKLLNGSSVKSFQAFFQSLKNLLCEYLAKSFFSASLRNCGQAKTV